MWLEYTIDTAKLVKKGNPGIVDKDRLFNNYVPNVIPGLNDDRKKMLDLIR
jgi:hypothetical protein